ncbi:MAG: OmpA family protein [Bacteroidetes bacterium]|nr:OmpA family protein [Bacteroidota bacterium]
MNTVFKITLLLAFSFLAHVAVAQRSLVRSADEAFDRKQYSLAIDRYKKAFSRVKDKDEKNRISWRLAESYRLTGNFKRAEATYRRVMRSDLPERNPSIYLIYADLLKAIQKYPEAIEYYNLYAKAVPDDPRGPEGAAIAAQIEEWIANPSRFEVTLVRQLNSRESDFAATWASSEYNEIIFTSTRDGSTGKEKDRWTNQSFSDLYTSRLDRNEKWSTPQPFDNTETINTKANEGAPHMNSAFNTLYFTRCNNSPQQASGCQIMVSSRQGRSWSQPVPLQIRGVDSLDIIGHPSLSKDELTIYFSADRKGGFGGKDIWMAMRDNKSQPFGRPINLGPEINTPGDEVFPFLRNDTSLYFASNGHPGMGGLDIFVSSPDENGRWGKPRNMKYPMNSVFDDFAVIFHPTEEKGFFSSNRDNIRGVDNLFYFIEPPVLFTLSGTVKDEKTLQFVEDATVKLIGSNGTSVSTRTNDKGFFKFGNSQVDRNTTYEIIVDKPNYFTASAVETTVGLEFSKDLVKDFLLSPIPQAPIVLPDILYDLARWELKPQFEDSLQGLILTLQRNPTIVIELASHTDSRDTEERNDILSQRRAQSVVDYLIARGIEPERLVAKGYGERVPRRLERDMVVNGFTFKSGTVLTEEYINSLRSNEEKEAAHQLNRRTEFRILSKDYVPKPTNEPVGTAVRIVLNPEENQVSFNTNADGAIVVPCLIDGYNENFVFIRNQAAQVSLERALDWLRKGILSRDNLEGDAEQLIGAGRIADGAVFRLKEIRIANRTITDVAITVNHKSEAPLIFGHAVLSRMGEYEIDARGRKLIFK